MGIIGSLETLIMSGFQTADVTDGITLFRFRNKIELFADMWQGRSTIRPSMTVCIAAIANGGTHVVTAADRMFTVGPPLNVEFEPQITKVEQMSPSCLAMGAGNSLFVDQILKSAKEAYRNVPGASVTQIAISVKEAYAKLREESIEEQIVKQTLGNDFLAFRARGGTLPAYLQPQPAIYQQIIVQANQFNLGVDLIVTGIDDGGSHVYYVGNPGTMVSFDKIGYNAVGSGASHVAIRFALECMHPKTPLEDVLLAVYLAKKAAEVAPGVGQETEIRVISSKEVWPAPDSFIATLQEAQSEKAKKAAPNADKVKAEYAKLRKDA